MAIIQQPDGARQRGSERSDKTGRSANRTDGPRASVGPEGVTEAGALWALKEQAKL